MKQRSPQELTIYGSLVDDFEYQVVTIHPLASDIAYLEKFNIEPEDVILCDMYWHLNGVIYFVSIYYNEKDASRITVHKNARATSQYAFNVMTHHKPLDKLFLRKVLAFLAEFLDQKHSLHEVRDNRRKLVLDGDIADINVGTLS